MNPANVVSIEKLTAVFRNIRVPMGLVIDQVEIDGSALDVIIDPIKFEMPHPGSVKVTISAESLAAFLDDQAPGGLRNFEIKAENDKLEVKAVKTILVDVAAKAICTLRVVDGAQLFVDVQDVEVMGAGAKKLVQSQIDKLNPVFDVKELPIHVRLNSVRATNGELLLTGVVSPPRLG